MFLEFIHAKMKVCSGIVTIHGLKWFPVVCHYFLSAHRTHIEQRIWVNLHHRNPIVIFVSYHLTVFDIAVNHADTQLIQRLLM